MASQSIGEFEGHQYWGSCFLNPPAICPIISTERSYNRMYDTSLYERYTKLIYAVIFKPHEDLCTIGHLADNRRCSAPERIPQSEWRRVTSPTCSYQDSQANGASFARCRVTDEALRRRQEPCHGDKEATFCFTCRRLHRRLGATRKPPQDFPACCSEFCLLTISWSFGNVANIAVVRTIHATITIS